MPPLKSLMASRARGSRKLLGPKTPEPMAEGGGAKPSSPTRPRFRLRRRTASQREAEAPTQQFLASVAAADVPIPSIEEPRPNEDEDMLMSPEPMVVRRDPVAPGFLELPTQALRGGSCSPRTPAPCAIPSLSPKRFPDWSVDQAYSSLESSSDCESSRPSTAQSTQTSASLFSRFSTNSDGFSHFSMDPDDFGGVPFSEDPNKTIKAIPIAAASPRRRSRKAPWTRSMSQHLWSTYTMYLQDPHVTPFHLSKAGIPPSGVCMRVARQAKRSWKGSRTHATKNGTKSASATPTVDSFKAFVSWPHSCAATRAHLRELCQINAGTSARNHPYLTQRATTFGRTATRLRSRRATPSFSTFSGSDMALSLAVSTCESMQPLGPLAQLTASEPEPIPKSDAPAPIVPHLPGPVLRAMASHEPIARLGSPFMVKTYGASPSEVTADGLGPSFVPRKKSHSVSHIVNQTTEVRRNSLRSPVKLNSSRGSTQKRRSRQPELEPRKKRPSLSLDTWTAPAAEEGAGPAEAACAEFNNSTSSDQKDMLFVPRPNMQQHFFGPPGSTTTAAYNDGTTTNDMDTAVAQEAIVPLLPADIPRRLGSPFTAAKTSFSFPSRSSGGISALDFGAIRRPFTTVQVPSDVNTTPTKSSSLRSRLAYIDERLKDFRRRDSSRRRSRSPQQS